MEFIILFVSVFAGVVAGWYLREFQAKRVVDNYLAEVQEKVEEEKKNAVRIKIEKHHEHIYVFEHDTDKFLGQAATIDELDKYLSETYPGKRFLVQESEAEAIGVKL